MTLDTYLAALPGRCPNCGHAPQFQGHAPTCGVPAANKADGQARADSGADPDLKAALDAEIRRLAATREPFSANSMRSLGATGGVVGGRFTAAARAGLIRKTGNRVTSNLASTHAHPIEEWVGAG